MKGKTILYSMLALVPVSFWLGLSHASPVAVFVVSCLAIISWILILTYLASLVFQFRTHHRFFAPEGTADAAVEIERGHPWSVTRSVLVLLAAATLIGFVSELLVHAVDAAGTALGLVDADRPLRGPRARDRRPPHRPAARPGVQGEVAGGHVRQPAEEPRHQDDSAIRGGRGRIAGRVAAGSGGMHGEVRVARTLQPGAASVRPGGPQPVEGGNA